jgi:hypothetical protein
VHGGDDDGRGEAGSKISDRAEKWPSRRNGFGMVEALLASVCLSPTLEECRKDTQCGHWAARRIRRHI